MADFDTDGNVNVVGIGAASLETLSSMGSEQNGTPLSSEVTETKEFQEKALLQMSDDMHRLRLSIPDRKRKAITDEINLRKVLKILNDEKYSQRQINQILSYNMCYDLHLDLIKKYDETYNSLPDISDLDLN